MILLTKNYTICWKVINNFQCVFLGHNTHILPQKSALCQLEDEIYLLFNVMSAIFSFLNKFNSPRIQALHLIVISSVGPSLPETTIKLLSQNKVLLKI